MTRRMTTSDIRNRMSEVMELVADPDGAVIITRHGRDAAALVSIPMLGRILRAGSLAPVMLETKSAGASAAGDELRMIGDLADAIEALSAELDGPGD